MTHYIPRIARYGSFSALILVGTHLGAQQVSPGESSAIFGPSLLGQTPAAPSEVPPPPPPPAVTEQTALFLSQTNISGFLSASYLYNFNRPSSDLSTGRSFDVNHDEFHLNKFHLQFDNPVDYNSENWDAGFGMHLILGQDATLLQAAGLALGAQGDLEQANFTVNVPVGNGLKVSMGKWATLMGVEVLEETINPNWSVGNQFLFVENFTALGVQGDYKWADWLDTQLRFTNGWDVVKDNNDAKSVMGRIGISPDEGKTSIALIGYAGPEQSAATNTGTASAWRKGVELVASRKITDDFTAWVQLDYGHEDENTALPDPTEDAEWYALGLWLAYQIEEQIGVAFRYDYLNDADGARTSGAPFTAPFPANTFQELHSLTFTLNYKPLPNVQVRPELRWDHSTFNDAFDGDEADQVTMAIGAAYIF